MTASLKSYTLPRICSVNSDLLHENKIEQWTDLPLWLDCDDFTYDNTKMLSDLQLQITDFQTSIEDIIGYYNDMGWKKLIYGISDQVREKLIKAALLRPKI